MRWACSVSRIWYLQLRLGTPEESTTVGNLPFFRFKFWRGIPGNQEEGSHWVHVTQGYRNKNRWWDCYILLNPSILLRAAVQISKRENHSKFYVKQNIICSYTCKFIILSTITHSLYPQRWLQLLLSNISWCPRLIVTLNVRARPMSHCVPSVGR